MPTYFGGGIHNEQAYLVLGRKMKKQKTHILIQDWVSFVVWIEARSDCTQIYFQ